MIKHIRQLILILILSILLSPVSTVLAVESDKAFYSANDILFYDPEAADINCSVDTGSSPGVSGSFSSPVDYAGNPIFNDARFAQMEENKPFYEKAASEANIPWQIIAAIHFKETGLKRYNPPNNNGPYQILGTNYPPSETISDAVFLEQTKEAALFIKNKSSDKNALASGDPDEVKNVFFKYNGATSAYVEQAQRLGFGDKGYEGSPYVMNKADEKRDPEKNKTTWGQIKQDGGAIEYPANNDYGAFVVFAALSGVSLSGTDECSDIEGGGQLISGGMTLDQARSFMEVYKSGGEDSIQYIGGASQGCDGGALANCVSFSVYFINKYTNISGFESGTTPGHGKDVVQNIKARNPGIKTGIAPQPYAIYSTNSIGGEFGHTGVVLGVDADKGKVILGEASCTRPLSWADAHEYNISDLKGTFAYTDGLLREAF